MANNPNEVTRLLQQWHEGDSAALDRLLPMVFDDVRAVAHKAMQGESAGHTLQPTALINEAYMRLIGRETYEWKNRLEFFGCLAKLMRRILVDHARRRLTAKRGAGQARVSLEDILEVPSKEPDRDLLRLHDALKVLEEVDSRKYQVVMLRHFMGLTQTEISEALGISVNTVARDWQAARLFLQHEIEQKDDEES